MNRNILRYLALSLVIFVLAACNDVASAPPQDTAGDLSAADLRTNKALGDMAQLFARAVSDSGLRQQIHDLAAKRFDGDTNVLYKTLAAESNARSMLASAYNRGLQLQSRDALAAVDTLARAIPRFQLAVPANLEKWDAKSYTPLVGFMPEGVEDTTLKTITAYDASGKAYTLDAQVAPKQPVIILGLSERTDELGNVRSDLMAPDEDAFALTPQGRYEVRVINLTLYDDNEPWPKGDPEVMLISQGPSLYYHAGFTQADHEDALYVFDRIIGTTTGDVIFYWYEDDSGSLDFTVSYKGVSLNTKIADDDDYMGAIMLTNGYFKGGTNNVRNLGELSQTTD